MDYIPLIILVAALSICCVTDFATHKIFNFVTFPLIGAGIAIWSFSAGVAGLGVSLFGAAVGLAAFIPFYLLGAMGAGDVKLMAGVGSFMGPQAALWAVAFTLICGGVMAVVYVVWSIVRRRIKNRERGSDLLLELTVLAEIRGGVMRAKFPYALAIAAGTVLAWHRSGFLLASGRG